MSSSTQVTTNHNNAALTVHDLAFVETIARKLSSLASTNHYSSPLAMLSCVADLTLKEEFPDADAAKGAAPSATPSEAYDADTEDAAPLDEWPRFESGERVRVRIGSSRDPWQYFTIANLKAFPPQYTEDGCEYPVLTKTKPRVISYINSKNISRVHPW